MHYLAQTNQTDNTINTTLQYIPPEPAQSSNNTLLYIGIAIAVLMVIATIILILKKKKQPKTTQTTASSQPIPQSRTVIDPVQQPVQPENNVQLRQASGQDSSKGQQSGAQT